MRSGILGPRCSFFLSKCAWSRLIPCWSVCLLLALLSPGRVTAGGVRSVPIPLARLTGARMFGGVEARLQRARPDETLDVVVTFRAPLDQVNFTQIQAEVGAFGSAQPLWLARSVATRMTRNQIAALARIGIVEQLQ